MAYKGAQLLIFKSVSSISADFLVNEQFRDFLPLLQKAKEQTNTAILCSPLSVIDMRTVKQPSCFQLKFTEMSKLKVFEQKFTVKSSAAIQKTRLGDVPQTARNSVFPVFVRKQNQKQADTKTEIFGKVTEHGVVVNSKATDSTNTTILSFNYAQVTNCKGKTISGECVDYHLITEAGLKSVSLCATNKESIYRTSELSEIRASVYVNCLEQKLTTLFDENQLTQLLTIPKISLLKAADLALEHCETEKSVFELQGYLKKHCAEGNETNITTIQGIRRKVKNSWFELESGLQEESYFSDWSASVTRQFSDWKMNSTEMKTMINEISEIVESGKKSKNWLSFMQEILQNKELEGKLKEINTLSDRKSKMNLMLQAYWALFNKLEGISSSKTTLSQHQINLLAKLNSSYFDETLSKLPGLSQISQEIEKTRKKTLKLDFYGLNSILQSTKSYSYSGKLLEDVLN